MSIQKRMMVFISFLLLVATIPFVLANNNPGHDSLYILRTGDTIAGVFNFTERIMVPVPSQPSDAATMQYVDDQIGGSGDVGGSGTTGYIPRWSSSKELEDSIIFDDGLGSVGIGTASPDHTLDVSGDGRFTGTVFVAPPTAGGHAATRDFVLSAVGGVENGSVREVHAGTGILASPNPITETGTISLNRTYTDGLYVEISGDTMAGILDMGGNRITNLATPTASSDAATRDYVLSAVGDVNWSVAGDTGSSTVVGGETVTIAGGNSITTTESGRTVTIDVDDDFVPYSGATQDLNFNNRDITNVRVLEGHNSDYGTYSNSTHTIIGYIGGLT